MNRTAPVSLEQVKSNFEQWRSSRRNRKTKIPQALWDQVYPLTQFNKPSVVRTTLRISGSQYNEHKPRTRPEATFVEVPMQASPTKTSATQPAFTKETQRLDVELMRADGARLCIQQLDNQSISNLIQAFLG